MKRLQDLTPADLERAAVWRYEGESDDAAHVRATARTELAKDERDLFIARTQFTLANGSHHIGFCTPDPGGDFADLQPVIVTADGPVYFSFDAPPSQETLDAQWSRLGVGREQICGGPDGRGVRAGRRRVVRCSCALRPAPCALLC